MKYSKAEMIKECLRIIDEYKLMFITDILAYVPYHRATFYRKGCDKDDSIKTALEDNRIRTKQNMRAKWYNSDNPALQIALYKLICDEEEADRLNGSKQKHSFDDEKVTAIEFKVTRSNENLKID